MCSTRNLNAATAWQFLNSVYSNMMAESWFILIIVWLHFVKITLSACFGHIHTVHHLEWCCWVPLNTGQGHFLFTLWSIAIRCLFFTLHSSSVKHCKIGCSRYCRSLNRKCSTAVTTCMLFRYQTIKNFWSNIDLRVTLRYVAVTSVGELWHLVKATSRT